MEDTVYVNWQHENSYLNQILELKRKVEKSMKCLCSQIHRRDNKKHRV